VALFPRACAVGDVVDGWWRWLGEVLLKGPRTVQRIFGQKGIGAGVIAPGSLRRSRRAFRRHRASRTEAPMARGRLSPRGPVGSRCKGGERLRLLLFLLCHHGALRDDGCRAMASSTDTSRRIFPSALNT
jgi:hypothetical protein